MSKKRRRTQEEIARSVEAARNRIEQRKVNDGISSIRSGRIMSFVTAVYFLAIGFLLYKATGVIQVFYIYGPLILLYVVLGIVHYRSPFVCSIIALSIFVFITITEIYIGMLLIIFDLIIRIFLVYSFAVSIRNAKKYQKLIIQKENPDDVLDNELIK